jgi:DNA adenine methylase
MRYLGGKMRQSKQIVAAIGALHPDFETYIEPFCGALWSAQAAIKAFPNRRYVLNDINPHLVDFWREAANGWSPPAEVSEATYAHYNKTRPSGDPMTGYVGFAWSFGGKFFGGAARTGGQIKGSYKSTMAKIDVLRSADVSFLCGPFGALDVPNGSMVYLDPPYEARTRQSHFGVFNKAEYLRWAEGLAARSTVIATEFVAQPGWDVMHNYGDTVVRHLNAKPKDGTHELLMKVNNNQQPTNQ